MCVWRKRRQRILCETGLGLAATRWVYLLLLASPLKGKLFISKSAAATFGFPEVNRLSSPFGDFPDVSTKFQDVPEFYRNGNGNNFRLFLNLVFLL